MKVRYVVNRYGINEYYSAEKLGVDNIGEDQWTTVHDFKSDIIKEYKVYEDFGMIKCDDNIDDDVLMEEIDRVDELLWW